MNINLNHIHKLLIANRGEIACRIIRSAKSLGLSTVAIYTQADEGALHTLEADEMILIEDTLTPDGTISGYLNIEQIIAGAKLCQAQAIHPGYGFLSENAAFAEAVAAQQLIFVGPKAETIRLLGHKVEAKKLANKAGIPILQNLMVSTGSQEINTSQFPDDGWPWLIKAAAGGGGRGMRIVHNKTELAKALKQAATEARQHFGDATVFLEQYIPNARHIEVQIFGDHTDQVHHLWHRDCSVQRRYQKIIEEAPAPNLAPAICQAMIDAAIRLAQSQHYLGAGTVEFLVAPDGRWFFLEMNTRLQVEHPATEFISHEDLVRWQLIVADGQPLPDKQLKEPDGHAIELRICAEDVEKNFAPATGVIKRFSWPQDENIRVDHALYPGLTVSPLYDSLLAKMIVWAPTRQQAIAKLQKALAKTHIDGIKTNLEFHRQFIQTEIFKQVGFHTTTLDTFNTQPKVFNAMTQSLALAAGTFLQTHRSTNPNILDTPFDNGPNSPWQTLIGWRNNQARCCHHFWQIEDDVFIVRIESSFSAKSYEVTVQKIHRFVENSDLLETVSKLTVDFYPQKDQALICFLNENQQTKKMHFHWFEETAGLRLQNASGSLLLKYFQDNAHNEQTEDLDTMVSHMPGIVKSILVKPNDTISKGSPLIIVESMKIEQSICATKDGIVEAIFVEPGEAIESQQKLVHIASTED